MNVLRHLGFSLLFICFISCASTDAPSAAEQEKISYEQTKNALLEKEQSHPALFLQASAHNKKNLIGQTVIKGKVTNSATIAAYRDIEIKIEFYSKTNTLLETDKETLYIDVGPGRTQEFKTKYFSPKGTDSVAISVLGAKASPR